MELIQGYWKTEAGVLPKDWGVVPLGTLVRITSGDSPSHFRFLSSGVPYYKVEQLSNSNKYLSQESTPYHFSGHKTVPSRSIVFAKRGAAIALNKIRILRDDSFMDTNLMALTPADGLDSEYLYYALSHIGLWQFADTTSVPQINNKHIKPLAFPLPGPSEQRTIAAALSDVDALLDGLERLIAKKRDLKQAAMQQLLTGQTRLPGFNGEWQTKPLGALITRCFSGATPRRNRPEFYQGDVRWITSGELNYNVITDTVETISREAVAKTNLSIVPAGTFLMAITGLEAEGTRGACAIVGAPSATNQSCMAVFPTAALVTEYLFHYYVCRGKALALQYCQGTKQQSYTARLVRQLPIDLPPSPDEQTAIAIVLSDMDAEMVALETRRDKTRDLKQAMMQELLTGKTRLVSAGGTHA